MLISFSVFTAQQMSVRHEDEDCQSTDGKGWYRGSSGNLRRSRIVSAMPVRAWASPDPRLDDSSVSLVSVDMISTRIRRSGVLGGPLDHLGPPFLGCQRWVGVLAV